MSKYCVVRTCKARAALTVITGEKITIHKFPQEEDLRKKWELFVNYANRSTDFRSKNHCLCSRHFDPSCYFYGRLRNNAVPNIVDAFTPEIALQYGLIPHLYSSDLAILNDYTNTFIKLRNHDTSHDNIILEKLPVFNNAMKKKTANTSVNVDETFKDVKLAVGVMSQVQSGAVGGPGVGVNSKNSVDIHKESVYVESASFGVECVNVKTEIIDDDDTAQSSSTFSNSLASPTPGSPIDERCLHYSRARQRRKRTAYCGDLSPTDFLSPRRCELNLEKFKVELSATNNRLRVTNQKIRRADKKILTLQSILSKLNSQTSLSAEDFRVLKRYGIFSKLEKESEVGDSSYLDEGAVKVST